FLVDVDLFMTDTARLADLVLPACTSFERSELKFYPEQHVIWTGPVIEPLGESRPDADIIFDMAARLAPEDPLLKKGYKECVDWILKPTGLKVDDLKRYPSGYTLKDIPMPPYRKYEGRGFDTPSGKMEFTSTVLEEAGIDPLPRFKEPGLSPWSTPEVAGEFPLILTTGARLPIYVHSRTFRLPWIRRLRPDPMVDMNPVDAQHRDLSPGDWVELSTQRGKVRVRANLTEIVPPGTVNIFHNYPGADINKLIEPDYLDPISGYPGFKSLLCEIRKAS
ncbi:MAG: molybdopterin-dependent oxidoreductase, partial [Deltaproteobacteria bacterium]|nr:molybdopterin-dependent oxidoreductase [Deltaproteobacteria bacterium]